MEKLKAYVVNGFIESGKTTYINKSIARDFFYKRGTTLIISFEEGEQEYDYDMLASRRTNVVFYEGGKDITAFCISKLEEFRPDRVYIEANVMEEELWPVLRQLFDIVFVITLISGEGLSMYYKNMRQHIIRMLESANMVIFNRTDKSVLADYATGFRLMNNRCDYLWQSEMGYSEKAFGVYLPYSLEDEVININDSCFEAFYLDATECPSHYLDKKLIITCQVEKRDYLEAGHYIAGRPVMTCCPADIQFLGFEFAYSGSTLGNRCWVRMEAVGYLYEDCYHQSGLRLRVVDLGTIAPAGGLYIG